MLLAVAASDALPLLAQVLPRVVGREVAHAVRIGRLGDVAGTVVLRQRDPVVGARRSRRTARIVDRRHEVAQHIASVDGQGLQRAILARDRGARERSKTAERVVRRIGTTAQGVRGHRPVAGRIVFVALRYVAVAPCVVRHVVGAIAELDVQPRLAGHPVCGIVGVDRRTVIRARHRQHESVAPGSDALAYSVTRVTFPVASNARVVT